MEQEQICNTLIERGYPERLAKDASREILSLSEELVPLMEKWLETGIMTDYIIGDFSIEKMILQRGMMYPAAILTMDWILKEPGTAIPYLSKKRK